MLRPVGLSKTNREFYPCFTRHHTYCQVASVSACLLQHKAVLQTTPLFFR